MTKMPFVLKGAGADYKGDRPSSRLSILLNDGRGTLGAPIDVALAEDDPVFAVADFNRDGLQGRGGFHLSTCRSFREPRRRFAPVTLVRSDAPLGSQWGIATGDLNGDGNADFVTNATPSGLVVFLGTGRAGFQRRK